MAKTEGTIVLDGSQGEGGGQILRSALTLSLLTGRPFRIEKIRANREKPGLRPQHVSAVEAAARLSGAEVSGAGIGSRALEFAPRPFEPADLRVEIGTAGATALVLQTLHPPIAILGDRAVRLTLTGGTFNTQAPSFPFLQSAWRGHLAKMGLPVVLAMPEAGFFPRGGGRLEAWIEPAKPRPLTLLDRGPLLRIRGVAGTSNLARGSIADRLRDRAADRLARLGVPIEIETADWPGPGPGAAIGLVADYAETSAAFDALGAPGKPAEAVADEAADLLLAFDSTGGAVDPHSADQILLYLAMAEGRSAYTVSEMTEHLRTNARTIRAFLDREIRIDEPDGDRPGRVVVG